MKGECMLTKWIKRKKTGLEEAIDELLLEMKNPLGDTDEYAKMAKQLQKLYKLKAIDGPKKVSPDTLALVIGNLIGIILIVGHERANVIGSKALTFVQKLK